MEVLTTLDSVGAQSAGREATVTPTRPSRSRRLITVVSIAAVIAVLVLASAWWRGRSAFAAHVDRSIAVLPLTNLSGDPANDYFGEGLAEEMTNALGKAGLRVIGRSSARTLVTRGLDAPAIARQLGVGSALQGAVQRSGDRLRITISLVSAGDSLMWTEKYDRDIKDLFAVQDEIARSVAGQLRVTLTGGRVTLARRETDDTEAHDAYMQGLYAWKRRSAVTLKQAIGRFEQAVRRDPKFAEAYAGIDMAYVVLPVYADVPTDSMLTLAVNAARRAVAIDSTLPEAHAVLGYANATRFQNAAAEMSFAKAITLDSGFATAHFWHSILLGHTGRTDDAVRESRPAPNDAVHSDRETGLGGHTGGFWRYQPPEGVQLGVAVPVKQYRVVVPAPRSQFPVPSSPCPGVALRPTSSLFDLPSAYSRFLIPYSRCN